jgi:hypothetical protein
MKLLIHIGTQKTATTSIQRFCAHNRDLLQSHGYLYPKAKINPFVFNFLAGQLAKGQGDLVTKYLQKVRAQAQGKKCHTVIISAESFYGMTWFFRDLRGKPRDRDYWRNEARLIDELRQCCSGYDGIRIACYLRPQDEFASSFYNQLVKNAFGISDTFEEFLAKAKPIFDYESTIRVWENIFGADFVSPQNFFSCKEEITKDFFEKFLETNLFSKMEKKEYRINSRLSRDVLEFKRIFNKTKPDRSLAYISARCFKKINSNFTDKPGYQIFAALKFRKNFFSLFEDGNRRLAERHNMEELPVIVDEQDSAYPGMLTEKALEVSLRLRIQLDQPRNKLELGMRRFVNNLIGRFPAGKFLLTPIRVLNNKLRLLFSIQ